MDLFLVKIRKSVSLWNGYKVELIIGNLQLLRYSNLQRKRLTHLTFLSVTLHNESHKKRSERESTSRPCLVHMEWEGECED